MYTALRFNTHLLICLGLSLAAMPLSAARLPVPASASGGILDRELERQYETEEIEPYKEEPQVDVELPENEMDLSSDERVSVKKIQVVGNTLVSDRLIAQVTKSYEKKEISMKEISSLCKEIQRLYTDKGYFLVRVFPPVQKLTNGEMTLQVLEVKIGRLEVEGNEYYQEAFVRRYLDRFEGKCPKYKDLIRQVLLLNEFSDLQVGVVFQKGKSTGTTDMVVKVNDKLPVHFYADYNNYGPGAIASKRAGAKFTAGNTLLQGDHFTLIGVMGFPYKHLQFIDGIYSFPVNANGTSLELAALHSSYKIQRLNPLRLEGETLNVSAAISQALHRTPTLSTTLFAQFDYLDVRTKSKHDDNGYKASPVDDFLRTLTFGGKADYLDGLKGRNLGVLELVVGIPSIFDGSKPEDSSSSRKGAGGRFGYLNGSYQRLQPMPLDWLLFFNFQGQAAFTKLPVSEAFYVGGISTVRGFPMATAVGDSGLYFNLEARVPAPFFAKSKLPWSRKKTWGDVLHFVTFLDHGEVYVIGDKGIVDGATRTSSNSYKTNYQSGSVFLTSMGLGLRVFGPWDIDVNVDWGFPLSSAHKSSDSIFYIKVSKKFL